MIDGKARLVSDLMCDGLGACLGHCPQGAITIEEREAEAYDEPKVMENIIKQGTNTIKAHLIHLRDHGQMDYFKQAVQVLNEKGINNPLQAEKGRNMQGHGGHSGCPGSRAMNFEKPAAGQGDEGGSRPSQLTHWPVQLHLISPMAPQYQGKDLLLSADCVAYSMGDFHKDYLKGKALAIACPKLDDNQEIYEEKITALIDEAKINTLTVMIMQVPCCGGLLQLAKRAGAKAKRKIPIKAIVVGLQGGILSEDWV
jgi:ferredoxin